MKHTLKYLALLSLLAVCQAAAYAQLPSLHQKGSIKQLHVHGKPYLIRGGELGNSTASDLEYMATLWPKFRTMNLNTILAPVYWELIEPEEGRFDFTSVRELIDQARSHGVKLVLLWFGAWKNSMSCYAPAWVKKDPARFPRAQDHHLVGQEILTPFDHNNLNATKKAFTAFMAFLKQNDSVENTVIMVQVENEIGMLPEARDHSPAATHAFRQPIPQGLAEYLQQPNQMVPEFEQVWQAGGRKTSGDWEAIFGKGLHTDEIFMAWHYGVFVNELAKAGKEIYPLPMFVNAALNRTNAKPGEYPSAGPLPHLMNIWQVAAPDIDMLSPDFYNPDFKHWSDLYVRANNTLFIPEIRFEDGVDAKALFAIGYYGAMGFSPFSIESTSDPENEPLAKTYRLLLEAESLILQRQGSDSITAVLLDKAQPGWEATLGGYRFNIRHDYTLGWGAGAASDNWPITSAIIVMNDEDDFYVIGTGVVVTFTPADRSKRRAGILNIDKGSFVGGKWTPTRRMNGDQSHQGRHLRIPVHNYDIQRVRLYQYD